MKNTLPGRMKGITRMSKKGMKPIMYPKTSREIQSSIITITMTTMIMIFIILPGLGDFTGITRVGAITILGTRIFTGILTIPGIME